MTIRSLRRYHKERMKKRARKVYPTVPNAFYWADNLAQCSCPMCGNPRRHFKGMHRLTVQERRELDRAVGTSDGGAHQ